RGCGRRHRPALPRRGWRPCASLRYCIRRSPHDCPMNATLESRVAIVTGGSRGIGLATAAALLARGASVAVTGTDAGRLDAAVRQLDAGDRVLGVRADVRQLSDVESLMSQVVERFGGLDILVNNAGVGQFVPVAEMSTELWHRIIDTNLTGVFYCCRAAIPHLRRRGGGWIINV